MSTLIEVIIVVAIFASLAGLLAVSNADAYREFIFHNEVSTLTTVLAKTRIQSMNNVCLESSCTDGKSHGVALFPNRYVVFQGLSYATRDISQDEEIEANSRILRSGVSEVVFGQLSGDVNVNGDIHLTDGMRSAVISINNEGRISW